MTKLKKINKILPNLSSRTRSGIHPLLIALLRANTKNFTPPLSDLVVAEYGNDPFLILVSCLLSLRAKDTMTILVVRDLFAHIRTAKQLCAFDLQKLENLIKRIGFYKNKARTLKYVACIIDHEFGGIVPQTYEQLISIKGVGPKTANLMLGVAFGQPAICVDVHVHRISNRLGLIKTKTPEQTEVALQKILEPKYWIEWNTLIVLWGQNVCTPVSPRCSSCAIAAYCKRVGVDKRR